MLKKILILIAVLMLSFGALGVVGCQDDSSNDQASTETKETKESDNGDDEGDGDDLPIPALFEEAGIKVIDGEVRNKQFYQDEEGDAGVAIFTYVSDIELVEIAEDLKAQLNAMNSIYISFVSEGTTPEEEAKGGLTWKFGGEKDLSAETANTKDYDYYLTVVLEERDGEIRAWYRLKTKAINEEKFNK